MVYAVDSLGNSHEVLTWTDAVARDLAAESVSEIDYTVMGVVVTTLALLLVVALMRHKIDKSAHGKPFVQTLLESVYRELSTLGIVEAAIFLVHHYYSNFNAVAEAIFAKVHFTIFYVALFNAFQSAILAILASRISTKKWIHAESIDVDHYVAIRHEFDKVSTAMQDIKTINSMHQIDIDSIFQFEWFSISQLWRSTIQTIKYPALKRKHHQLLMQIRFHELRVHFIESNNLPKKFRVSEYLKKSELDVLKSLVHISTFAWLSLMAAASAIYFSMGIVADLTGSLYAVGDALSVIFIGYCIGFVFLSLIIHDKMQSIYFHIMRTKMYDIHNIVDDDPAIEQSSRSERIVPSSTSKRGFGSNLSRISSTKQLDLFWGSDPHLIIGALQFMQFAYAIAFGVLLVFDDTIKVERALFPWFVYAIVPLGCYGLSVCIMSHVIPRYTLCTSLGQLVHKHRLNETVAKCKLEDEKRRRRKEMDEQEVEEAERRRASLRQAKLGDRQASKISLPAELSESKSAKPATRESSENGSLRTKEIETLSSLVRRPTKDLPQPQPVEKSSSNDRKQRRTRLKSLSDGVSIMRLLSSASDAATTALQETDNDSFEHSQAKALSEIGATRTQRKHSRLKKSQSENVAHMKFPMSSFFGLDDASAPPGQGNTDVGGSFPMKKSSSRDAMPSLIEGIPSRNVDPSELPFPIVQNLETAEAANKTVNKADIASKDIMQDGLITNGVEDDEDDDTVNSAESDAGHSNPDDLPTYMLADSNKTSKHHNNKVSLVEPLTALLMSRSRKFISGVFGTMVAFFLVGTRIEKFLLTEDIIPTEQSTWGLSLGVTFWLEFTWLSLFVFISVISIFLFLPSQDRLGRTDMVIASFYDVGLSGLCLGLLIWAESERCCSVGVDCCSAFGSRTYGGVGNIEPFTALVALRPMNWCIARWWRRRNGDCDENGSRLGTFFFSVAAIKQQNSPSTPDGYDAAKRVNEDQVKEFRTATGTVTELWKMAVGIYPDIVAKHGEFSGELLQTMLGISIVKPGREKYENVRTGEVPFTTNQTARSSLGISLGNENATGCQALTVLSPTTDQSISEPAVDPLAPTLTLSRRYKSLDAAARGIILAGRIGKPVKYLRQCSMKAALDYEFDCNMTEDAAATPGSVSDVLFEVDNDQEGDDEEFSYPSARLIRSMRRCQRKLPPLLDEWTQVDAVMTKYEIVYFDTTNLDYAENLHAPEGSFEARRHAVWEAMVATKGGKGLRLCDVAFGRKVVGHLMMSDIDHIKVERLTPTGSHIMNGQEHDDATNQVETVEDTELGADNNQLSVLDEYWKEHIPSVALGASLRLYKPALSLNDRWEQVDEYRLKLRSTQCVLHIRFFSDLEDEEILAELPSDSPDRADYVKNNAIMWCQTIARLCGTEQLHQKLPHFGDARSEELLDLLEVIERGSANDNGPIKKNKLSKFRHITAMGVKPAADKEDQSEPTQL